MPISRFDITALPKCFYVTSHYSTIYCGMSSCIYTISSFCLYFARYLPGDIQVLPASRPYLSGDISVIALIALIGIPPSGSDSPSFPPFLCLCPRQ